jgi:hypothetical protein
VSKNNADFDCETVESFEIVPSAAKGNHKLSATGIPADSANHENALGAAKPNAIIQQWTGQVCMSDHTHQFDVRRKPCFTAVRQLEIHTSPSY